MARNELPLPPHFDPGKIGQVWKIPYQERAEESRAWAKEYGISPAHEDTFRICLVAVDVQNTFCIPGFELFVRVVRQACYFSRLVLHEGGSVWYVWTAWLPRFLDPDPDQLEDGLDRFVHVVDGQPLRRAVEVLSPGK